MKENMVHYSPHIKILKKGAKPFRVRVTRVMRAQRSQCCGWCGPAHGERHRGPSARYSDQTWRFSMVAHAFNSSIWEAEAGRVLWQFQASQSWEENWQMGRQNTRVLLCGLQDLYAAQRSTVSSDAWGGPCQWWWERYLTVCCLES